MTREIIDIGHNHKMWFVSWSPDRERNPQYKDIPDIDPIGIIIDTGNGCESVAIFDVPGVRAVIGADRPVWTVESWEPLTLSPSLDCPICHDHGFIRNGRWVPA